MNRRIVWALTLALCLGTAILAAGYEETIFTGKQDGISYEIHNHLIYGQDVLVTQTLNGHTKVIYIAGL